MKVAGSGRGRRCTRPSRTWEPAVSASRASSARERRACAGGPPAPTPTPPPRPPRPRRGPPPATAAGPGAKPAARRRGRGRAPALQAQLAVLDLGDVGELGRQAGDAAQRAALLELQVALGLARAGVAGGQDGFSHRVSHTPTSTPPASGLFPPGYTDR